MSTRQEQLGAKAVFSIVTISLLINFFFLAIFPPCSMTEGQTMTETELRQKLQEMRKQTMRREEADRRLNKGHGANTTLLDDLFDQKKDAEEKVDRIEDEIVEEL